ncbi:dachsous cadherin-related 1 [Amblyomma americanum]
MWQWLLWAACCLAVSAELVQEFEVAEGVPAGSLVGVIGRDTGTQPPYLIVPAPGSAVDSDLSIDQASGQVRTSVVLDRELRSEYSFVAIPPSGDNVRVTIRVLDVNDNAPMFPVDSMSLEFPENTPRDVKRTLSPARDRDLGEFSTQHYRIASGNVDGAFRLASHRERDDVLYLDLQISGALDREVTPSYSLQVEAYDGGRPPLRGTMTVNITILDVNDNPPAFNQSRYVGRVPENASVGTAVLRVLATDADAGDNGRVRYSINRRQSDRDGLFTIDAESGLVSVSKPLDFEAKDTHELVVVARDCGDQPLEATAFVSVLLTDVNDNQPSINLIFLSDDASPKVSEDARPGELVARVSVNDPDSKAEYANVNVSLSGGDGHFGLATQDNIIYLVMVAQPLDRETRARYGMLLTATDQGSPPLNASRAFELAVTDTNDNAPEFDQDTYHASVLEVADPGTSVLQLTASDRDEGRNSMLRYSIQHTPDTYSQWFHVDPRTGLVTTRTPIDCETSPVPRVTVLATDSGEPPLSASATLLVTISDVNDNEPIFDQSFYNITVAEDEPVGKCVLRVSASDPDCGVNAMVNFTLGGGPSNDFRQHFAVHPSSGELCLTASLDREHRSSYEIPIAATDRGGLSTMAMVKVYVRDVNDNRPIFYPREYNVSLREQDTLAATPVAVVVASDADSGLFGTVSYHIVSGNDLGLFRVDPTSGELLVVGRLGRSQPLHELRLAAQDGGGLQSLLEARVYVSVLGRGQQPPLFQRPRYAFQVREDAAPSTVIGTVAAAAARTPGGQPHIRYSIYSGDPEGYFSIDAHLGSIRVERPLDHEAHPFLLLNVQATSGTQPPAYGHTQVNVTIWDVNDNAPRFESAVLKLSLPENVAVGTATYVAQAQDADAGRNGAVRYTLLEAPPGLFELGPRSGRLALLRPLDYEAQPRVRLVLGAADGGTPAQSASMTLLIEVQDVNDNAPIFDRPAYSVSVLESLPANSHFLQVSATDRDTGNNARLTFRLSTSNEFGIFPNSGLLYLREPLDREASDLHRLTVVVVDNGSPAMSATASIEVHVLDANDNAPEFNAGALELTVPENVPAGHLVGTLQAHDQDTGSNAALRYSLLQANSSFKVDPVTGDVHSLAPLDREAQASYELMVRVEDQGTPALSSTARLRVLVADENDNAPVFVEPLDRVLSVREHQPAGSELQQVRAVDADEGPNGQVVYEIVPGSGQLRDGRMAFAIDAHMGRLTTRVVLDRESQEEFSLVLLARDGGRPQREARLALLVRVLGLHQPPGVATGGSTRRLRVREGTAPGTVLGSLAPYPAGATFRLLGEPAVFDIGQHSGDVYTVGEVDFEVASEHQLQVRLDDAGITSLINVQIQVEDVNDCAPTFPEDPMHLSIAEDTAQGSMVWTFAAQDLDSGDNGKLVYRLEEEWPSVGAFEVEPSSGQLVVRAPLDREAQASFVLVVSAQDQPATGNPLVARVTCFVTVEDVNDHSPTFASAAEASVAPDAPIGAILLQLIAVDLDAGENGHVSYHMASGNEAGYFSLNHGTGLLTVVRSLAELPERLTLNVTASDNGTPRRSTHQELRVRLSEAPRRPPRFDQSHYSANISEDASVGTAVLTVRASGGGNLSYSLPAGGGHFGVDVSTGVVRTLAPLDREAQAQHEFVVFVSDGHNQADSCLVLVRLLDVNDQSPEFDDSCRGLAVPENGPPDVHTLVAWDRDEGLNARLLYSIAEGNVGDKFRLEPRTGRLTSAPLDRESVSEYRLSVHATDQGSPARTGSCTLLVTVLDENDEAPRFEQAVYSASVAEDAAPNTTVLAVRAHDPDLGPGGRVSYSLANETAALFRIDSDTGVLTTTGLFDREKRASYAFEVRASDSGRYQAHWAHARVQVTVVDVNDNCPRFLEFPYVAHVSPHAPLGSQVALVQAHDGDDGPNADVFYTTPSGGKLHLDADTGLVTVAASLVADSGRLLRLDLVAHDRGRPSRMASGVLEVWVGPVAGPHLEFSNASYVAQLPEGASTGSMVLQVRASASSQPGLAVTYSLGPDQDQGPFTIHPTSGTVRVRDSQQLDYEERPELELPLRARAETPSGVVLHGYARLLVQLLDENDNSPRFSQERYVASVWEGRSRGTFVAQVSALDADRGSRLVYHIAGGNVDQAFVLEPPLSGQVRTNTVLDREIRDTYLLTLVATDDGQPPRTGSCTLRITVIDANDNQPVFPPDSVVSIRENARVGSTVTTITANDVDTHPVLRYSLAEPGGTFVVDHFSGRLLLADRLDYEQQREYRLRLHVSDTAHVAETLVTVRVLDTNDHAPRFLQPSYNVLVSESATVGSSVVTVSATDLDSGDNGRIHYSLSGFSDGFYIDKQSGTVYTNRSLEWDPTQSVVQLLVRATDSGHPAKSSVIPLRIHLADINQSAPKFLETVYRASVPEDTLPGSTLLRVSASDLDGRVEYRLLDTGGGRFALSRGSLVLARPLEPRARYALRVVATDRGRPPRNATAQLLVNVEGRGPPTFTQRHYEAVVSEAAPLGHTLLRLGPSSPGLRYTISSGNRLGCFRLDVAGDLVVASALDYDAVPEMRLVVRATDSRRAALASVLVRLQDENDNAPRFPLPEYVASVEEGAPVGSALLVARAVDADRGPFGRLNYTLVEGTQLAVVDTATGGLTSATVFDYEAQPHFQLTIRATDAGGRWATARVHVHVLSRDEFAPVFEQEEYRFAVPLGAPVGHLVGRVHAHDRDRGPDGRVLYQIRGGSAHFRVNASSGTLSVRTPWPGGSGNRLELVASSGRRGSLLATAGVSLEEAPATPAAASASRGLPAWALALLLLALAAVAVLAAAVALLRGRLQSKRPAEPSLDTSFDTVDLRRDPFPAFYERPDDAAGAMHTSEVSEQSSGRGSAEDEDEEIRMINEGLRPQGDSGSDLSVRNTHEYLARLGIDPAAPIDSWAKAPSAPADDEDLSSLLYAKLDEPAESLGEPSMTGSLSSIVHSEEELAGSYNWDYLLDWGPQYQPLAHVFAEIARLKDDVRAGGAPPRSPVGGAVDDSYAAALSPSFSPALLPLASRSPSPLPCLRRTPPDS